MLSVCPSSFRCNYCILSNKYWISCMLLHTKKTFNNSCFLSQCTVASKFMTITESVRDAADLWLSLKYPPVMLVCDTPCTFVRHVNNREPNLAEEYWGENDGCFERPDATRTPNQVIMHIKLRFEVMLPPECCYQVLGLSFSKSKVRNISNVVTSERFT